MRPGRLQTGPTEETGLRRPGSLERPCSPRITPGGSVHGERTLIRFLAATLSSVVKIISEGRELALRIDHIHKKWVLHGGRVCLPDKFASRRAR